MTILLQGSKILILDLKRTKLCSSVMFYFFLYIFFNYIFVDENELGSFLSLINIPFAVKKTITDKHSHICHYGQSFMHIHWDKIHTCTERKSYFGDVCLYKSLLHTLSLVYLDSKACGLDLEEVQYDGKMGNTLFDFPSPFFFSW